eukprot:NODE_2761_length_998_cov_1.183697_g2741_i0.p3 GENE.NODE_2761_length_998_cov_1.183697_g2741_i0~~NODE_2761_length_998_cov_1.183697_g2741_i0.p3  ORF type:complete len:141 (+),score=9.74 NODE_2761_length_998_cov_1.183697_g2741_i0:574-996(+)
MLQMGVKARAHVGVFCTQQCLKAAITMFDRTRQNMRARVVIPAPVDFVFRQSCWIGMGVANGLEAHFTQAFFNTVGAGHNRLFKAVMVQIGRQCRKQEGRRPTARGRQISDLDNLMARYTKDHFDWCGQILFKKQRPMPG